MITRYCTKCDYFLTGLGDARRCPECGQPFDPANPATFLVLPRAHERHEKAVGFRLLMAGLLGAVFVLIDLGLQLTGVIGQASFLVPFGILWMLLAALVLTVWFLDLRWLRLWMLRREELLRQHGWTSLRQWHHRRTTTWRPFIRWRDRAGWRGVARGVQARDAMALSDETEAHDLARRAFAESSSVGVMDGIMRVEAAEVLGEVLLNLGRYDEALEQGEAMLRWGGHGDALGLAARVAFSRGRMNESQRLAREAIAADHEDATLTLAMSLALTGRGDEAIGALDRLIRQRDAGAGAAMPDMMAVVDASPARRLEFLIRQRQVAYRGGEPRLLAALLLLMNERLPQASARLDEAKAFLCRMPDMHLRYHGLRAVEMAGLSRGDDAERELASMERHRARLGGRRYAWEAHRLAAACHLTLLRFNLAAGCLRRAREAAIHPIDRHYTTYWQARCAELAGQSALAVAHYRAVIADGFDTWFVGESRASLSRLEKA